MFSSEKIRTQINSLVGQLRSYSFLHEKGNAERCAKILETILEQHTAYSLLCSKHSIYGTHFESLLERSRLEEDDVFLLLEDLLIFVREKTLRTGIEKANLTEKEALALVFSSSQWEQQDGSIFSDTFFHQTPLSIIQSISTLCTASPVSAYDNL